MRWDRASADAGPFWEGCGLAAFGGEDGAHTLGFFYGGEAEEAFEFAAELGGAFIAYAVGCEAGGEGFLGHEHAGFVKAHGFQVLER